MRRATVCLYTRERVIPRLLGRLLAFSALRAIIQTRHNANSSTKPVTRREQVRALIKNIFYYFGPSVKEVHIASAKTVLCCCNSLSAFVNRDVRFREKLARWWPNKSASARIMALLLPYENCCRRTMSKVHRTLLFLVRVNHMFAH